MLGFRVTFRVEGLGVCQGFKIFGCRVVGFRVCCVEP